MTNIYINIKENLDENFFFISDSGNVFSPNFGRLAILFAPEEYYDKNCKNFKRSELQERLAKNLNTSYKMLIKLIKLDIELIESYKSLTKEDKDRNCIDFRDRLRIDAEYFLIRSISMTEFFYEFYKDCLKGKFSHYREELEKFIKTNFPKVEHRTLLKNILNLFVDNEHGIRNIARNRLLHFPIYAVNIYWRHDDNYMEEDFFIEITDENVDTQLGMLKLIDLYIIIMQSLYLFLRLQIFFLIKRFSDIELTSEDIHYLDMMSSYFNFKVNTILVDDNNMRLSSAKNYIGKDEYLKFLL